MLNPIRRSELQKIQTLTRPVSFFVRRRKKNTMHVPKRGFENGPEYKVKYFPRRSLSDREQTLIDTTIAINDDSFDKDLEYFVSCKNDVNGVNCQIKG